MVKAVRKHKSNGSQTDHSVVACMRLLGVSDRVVSLPFLSPPEGSLATRTNDQTMRLSPAVSWKVVVRCPDAVCQPHLRRVCDPPASRQPPKYNATGRSGTRLQADMTLLRGRRRERRMEEQLIETWNIHDRINAYLLDAVPVEALGLVLAAKGRTVYQLFAHLH